jgi:ADP-ribose pyrophosphatase
LNESQHAENPVLLTARRFRVEAVRETTADGVVRTRQIVRHNGSVAIVPVVDADHVCLIRNFRIAAGQTLIEIPAGTLEPGEDPTAAAFRELAEETGYQAETMTPLVSCYLSPGILDERMQLFVATGLTPGPAAREPGEQIENLVTTWEDALQQVRQGAIQDAKTIVGLLTYLLTRG